MATIFVEVTSKEDPLYFTFVIHNVYSLQASQIFHLVWKITSAYKSISHCNLFEAI